MDDLLKERNIIACTQRAGDLFYLPATYWHATLNHGPTFALGSQDNCDMAQFRPGSPVFKKKERKNPGDTLVKRNGFGESVVQLYK